MATELRVGEDGSLTYRFYVGQKYVKLNLNVTAGEDVAATLTDIIGQEDIPVFLQDSMMAATSSLLEEEAHLNNPFAKPEGERNMAPLLAAADKLALEYERTHARWKPPISTEEQGALNFANAFKAILEVSNGESLFVLNTNLAQAMLNLITGKENALSNLQKRQAEEMAAAVANNHIEQLQAMEGTWKVEIRDLSEKQRQEFRLAVLNYEAAPPTKDASAVLSSSPSNISPTGSATSLNGSQAAPARAGWFQRQPKPKAPADAVSPQKKSMAESFSVYLGAQLKILFNIRLVSQEVHKLLKPRYAHAAWLSGAKALYSEELTALVLISEPDFSFKSKPQTDFTALCNRSAECHFPFLDDQLASIKVGVTKAGAAGLAPGDVVVTKHSNLNEVAAVFHLITEKGSPLTEASAVTSRSSVLAGLKSVLSSVADYDFATVYIPLLLLADTVPDASLTEPAYIKRAETILKSVRALLIANPAWGESLKTIHFMLPTASPAVFNRYTSLCKSVLT